MTYFLLNILYSLIENRNMSQRSINRSIQRGISLNHLVRSKGLKSTPVGLGVLLQGLLYWCQPYSSIRRRYWKSWGISFVHLWIVSQFLSPLSPTHNHNIKIVQQHLLLVELQNLASVGLGVSIGSKYHSAWEYDLHRLMSMSLIQLHPHHPA